MPIIYTRWLTWFQMFTPGGPQNLLSNMNTVDPVHLFLSLSSETVFEFAATAGKAICSGFLA